MADGISFLIRGTREVESSMRAIDKSVNRATMYAVRQAGRRVKQVARKNAPVYHGDRTDIPKGRLKRSVSSSRSLKRHGDGEFSVTVAPRGFPATAYAGKREAETPFMSTAHAAVAGELESIAAKAWESAMRKKK